LADAMNKVPRLPFPHCAFPTTKGGDGFGYLRVDESDLKRVWPPIFGPGKVISRDTASLQSTANEVIFMPIDEAARVCFDETGLFSDTPMGPELRVFQFIVLLALEANANPARLSIWGAQVPSQKISKIPSTNFRGAKGLEKNGTDWELHSDGPFGRQLDWAKLSVMRAELPEFIKRLKAGETAGQQHERKDA
jgi:hypothetical protein